MVLNTKEVVAALLSISILVSTLPVQAHLFVTSNQQLDAIEKQLITKQAQLNNAQITLKNNK